MAASMQPLMNEACESTENRKCKLGASSQDFMWLAGLLIDNMDENNIKQVGFCSLAQQSYLLLGLAHVQLHSLHYY